MPLSLLKFIGFCSFSEAGEETNSGRGTHRGRRRRKRNEEQEEEEEEGGVVG